MRILVAGASGVIGQRRVRLLAASGHAVTGTTRSPTRAVDVRASGATPLVVDIFDAMRLADAVAAARPEVIVHQLTDLPDRLDPRAASDVSIRNARIRDEGTRNLVAAAVRADARRLVAQSIAWLYAGPPPHRENDPLDTGAEGGAAHLGDGRGRARGAGDGGSAARGARAALRPALRIRDVERSTDRLRPGTRRLAPRSAGTRTSASAYFPFAVRGSTVSGKHCHATPPLLASRP
jgi:hypothetical protein